MIAFNWSTAPGNWPQLGPEIAETLRALATMPIEQLRQMPEPLSKPNIYRPVTLDIQNAVCDEFGIDRRAMLSERKYRAISRPRHIAMYLAHEITGQSTSVIGRLFNRDRSSVVAACAICRNATGETADTIARLKAQLMP